MPPLTRRQMLQAGLGTAALGLLSGCATPGTSNINAAPTIAPAGGKKITLTYWSWLKDLQVVADIWNAANPNVQVKTVWIPGGNQGGYPKLYSALAAGGGPDLAHVEFGVIPSFMMVNGLVDLTRYGAADHSGRYDPTLWNQVSYSGGIYGIPQDSGPMATYYQPNVLAKVGATAPTTWDEWAGVAAELRKANTYMDCFPLAEAGFFTALAAQAGARWFRAEEDGWVINMTDDATMKVARFFDAAIDKDLVQTQYGTYSPGWFASAADGGIASATSASWGDALIEGVSGGAGKWRVAKMPVWDSSGFGSGYLGGSTVSVLANSKHPREALEFAVWLTSSREGIDAEIKNCGIGWSPSPDFIGTTRQQPSDFFSGQNYNEEVFAPAALEQNTDWSWWPSQQQSFNILSDGFRQKASGTTLVDSVASAEEKIIQVFKNSGLSIRKEQA
ncbi:ABC transporter substrate-binding protein [Arthrobacter sp. HY1533]|uniref:ABC transporter substrate-binding protein n=1 Tax=Arthrobacter sp. HY1533 TaxID=2970919 RepID=UPI0022BA0330|nr:extracellular solute-binding protein [Arthrobacter sp. HY1533]